MECKRCLNNLGSIIYNDILTVSRFRWAACQLDALEECLDRRSLRKALASLPKTLDETYRRIISGIPDPRKQYAIRILQFLTYSERPLRIEEAVDVIAVETEEEPYFDIKDRLPDPQEISCYCSSLVVVVPAKEHSHNKDDKPMELQLAHFSVKEYLTSGRLDKDIAQNFQEIAAKASIAIVCLAYLLRLDVDLQPDEIRMTFPLAEYCARYWMIHAVEAEEKDETLQGFIRKFFCNHRNLQCYSLCQPDHHPSHNLSQQNLVLALYYASFGGLVNAVDYILSQKNVDVNAEGGYYSNALQAASVHGHEKVVELLLKAGANVNAKIRNRNNALQMASFHGHKKVVELLLKAGANVNAQTRYDNNALLVASTHGHEKVVELLLKAGANVNAQTGHDNALQMASVFGHEKVVELLLKAGANVNAQTGHDNALQMASVRGHEKVVELLKAVAGVNT